MNPEAIFRRLELTIGNSGNPRELRLAIEEELKTFFALTPINAAEKAEEFEERVRKLILEDHEKCHKQGTFSILAVSSASHRIILGSCCVEVGDSAPIQAAKRSRTCVPALLTAIRDLNFSDFEKFGARILHELGATKVRVTPHSNDQGIDFYGLLSIGELAGVNPTICQLAHEVTLRFAGQAKHYPTRTVGSDTVRELIGAIELARHRIFTSESDPFEELGLLPCHPLLGMLFTTGTFSSGALQIAKKSGLILRSGEQLAVFLADQGIGVVHNENATTYDETNFRAWLNT